MTILAAKNSLLEPAVAMRELSYWNPRDISPSPGRFFANRGIMTDADVQRIVESSSYYYLTNQLILTLTSPPEEVLPNVFKTDIDSTFPVYNADLFWRGRGVSGTVREWDNWGKYPGDNAPLRAKVVSVSPTKLVIEFSREAVQFIRENELLENPDFGILVLTISFLDPEGNEFEQTYGIRVTTHEPFTAVTERREEIPPVQPEYITPYYSFESLFIPKLEGKVVYNFYEPEEDNYDVIISRNYEGYKYSDIPKYIELTWTQAPNYVEIVPRTEERASESTPVPLIPGRRDDFGGTTVLGGVVFTLGGPSPSLGSGRTGLTPGVSPAIADAARRRLEEDGFMMAGAADSPSGRETTEPPPGFLPSFEADLPGLSEIDSSVDIGMTGPSIPEFVYPWLESGYVGYTIQKERYNEVDEVFIPVAAYVINGRLKNKFRDWNVAYGEVYRYRIRSIFRFVNKHNLPMYRDSDELIDNSDQFAKFETSVSRGHAESYYYDGKSSDDFEIETIEIVKPDSPFNVQIFPCSKKREIFICWNQKNQNKDVLGFNVYRKEKKNGRFVRLNSELIDIRDNFWIDSSIELEQRYIYAVESVDIHDNFSYLSAQYSAMIVPQNIDILYKKCEAPAQFVEWAGGTLDRSRMFEIQERTDNLMFTKTNMVVKINPLFSNLERTDPFLLKVTSLDTFEKKEIPIKFEIKTIYHRDPLHVYDAGFTSETPLDISETERPVGPGVGPVRF